MAVAFDAKVTATTDTGDVLTVSNSLTVGSGANRALVALFSSITGNEQVGLSIVWDPGGANQALTPITNAAGDDTNSHYTHLYALLNPASGTHTLTATWSSPAGESHLAAASFTGVDQTSVAVAFPHGAFKVATAVSGTLSITSAADNMVVAGYVQLVANFTATSGTTISLDGTATGNFSLGSLYDSGAATVNTTAAWGGTSTTYGAVGTDILAASGAPISLSPAQANQVLSFSSPALAIAGPVSRVPARVDAVLSEFSPTLLHTIAYLNPRVIDSGLEILFSEATHIHICSGQPVVYDDVAGMSLGNSNPGAGSCFNAIADAAPNGRQIATVAVSGAAVGGNGTAVAWAITDQSAGRLLAVNNLATPLAVSSGGTFNLPSFKIVIPEVGTDVLVGDTGEIDVGMEEFALVNKIVVCSAQPTDYATANTLTLGTKDFGVGNAFGSIIDAGWCHTIVSIPVTDGDVTDDGTAAYWAVLDDANSRLVATGPLTPSTAVTTGQKFTLTDIAIDIPILALSLIAAPAVLEYFYYLGF